MTEWRRANPERYEEQRRRQKARLRALAHLAEEYPQRYQQLLTKEYRKLSR